MDTRFDKLDQKIDKIVDKQGEMAVILAAQHESLKQHMRRTALLEDAIEPIKRHVYMINGGLKLIGAIAIVVELIKVLRV